MVLGIDEVEGRGSEVGYEISTCQMQYDAADQEDPCFIYLGGN